MPENFPTAEFLSIVALLVTVALLHGRGFLRADALAEAPDRGGVVRVEHLFLSFGLWMVGSFLSGMVAKNMAGAPPALAQLTAYAVSFGGPLALLLWLGLQSKESSLRLGLRGRANALSARVGLWGIPVGLVLVSGVNAIGLLLWLRIGREAPSSGHQVFDQMKTEGNLDILFHALTAVVLAPLCEEAFFRGLLQTGLQQAFGGAATTARLRWVAVGVAGALFGVVHYGAVPLPLLGGLFVFGWVLGFVYERTGCFWVPVAIHSSFNAISFCVGWLQIHQAK
jgi:membrane protease YdiL (CAAX protease family)